MEQPPNQQTTERPVHGIGRQRQSADQISVLNPSLETQWGQLQNSLFQTDLFALILLCIAIITQRGTAMPESDTIVWLEITFSHSG